MSGHYPVNIVIKFFNPKEQCHGIRTPSHCQPNVICPLMNPAVIINMYAHLSSSERAMSWQSIAMSQGSYIAWCCSVLTHRSLSIWSSTFQSQWVILLTRMTSAYVWDYISYVWYNPERQYCSFFASEVLFSHTISVNVIKMQPSLCTMKTKMLRKT